ncbi:unnamed protein product [Mytilus edulis]|uniref:B box-type domain-containing protein n=1 Tax=Mytilus edulis TaxID=6550 RepID=A0A8S3U7T0_MYTED|nr:unnamed protein product [Mytilus edulis]
MASVGQVPISCSLCEEDTSIQWKCFNCDMLMCAKCKEKIHVKFKFAKNHKVVSIDEVGRYTEKIDFCHLSCKIHPRQSCVLFCKSCDCLVCPICISETHNGHGLIAIEEGYEIKIEKLKTSQMNIRTNIDELQKRNAEIKDIDRKELSQFENTMKKIKDQEILLKNEVHQHIEKMKTELIKKWEVLHLYTENEQTEANVWIGSLESKNIKVDDIIQSKDATKVFMDGSGLVESMEEAATKPCTKFDSIPTFVPGQITVNNIEESEVTGLSRSIISKKSVVDKIIQSENVENVFKDGLELVNKMEETVIPPCTVFDSIQTFLPRQITAINIGALENVSAKSDMKSVKQFDTEISDVALMTSCSEDVLWISNQAVLQKVRIEESSLKIIDQQDIEILGMACTQSKDLLLVAKRSSMIV